MRFDEFIMERMGYPWGENEPDKQTMRQAFLVFRQRTGRVVLPLFLRCTAGLAWKSIVSQSRQQVFKWHLPGA